MSLLEQPFGVSHVKYCHPIQNPIDSDLKISLAHFIIEKDIKSIRLLLRKHF